MRSLNRPTIDPAELVTDCIAGIKDNAIREHYVANLEHLGQGIQGFEAASATATWCDLPRVPRGHKTAVIAGDLTKEQLMKLYSSYMVASSGAARHKYDELLVAANGWCPFCGGIGHVKTLDHYLPKANFPLYSIVPTNLVPCCRDCNSGKSNTFPTNANRQTIHPYLDGSHFFSERWISATASQTEPISVQFQAKPPLDWSAADRQRAICHFDDYKLATRYSIEAGAEISTIERARKTTFKDFASGELKQHLIEQGQNPSRPINGWHRTLYTALADTDWFLEGVPL